MKRLARPLLAALAVVATFAPAATAGAAMEPSIFIASAFHDGSAEGSFLAATNAARTAVGVAPLQWDASLIAYARGHASYMAHTGVLQHSTISTLLGRWSIVGENVGVGPSVGAVHQALMASPSHYHNLADGIFTHVGVGVFVDEHGRIWTAHVFGR
jgi:uncharacterized protein YkwD